MGRKLVKILLVLIIAIFSMQLKVQAAVITSTDKQVESNSGSVTIAVTSKKTLGSFKLKLNDTAGLTLENTTKGASSFEISSDKKTITGSSSDGITNLGNFTFKVPTVTNDTTYKIKFSISGMETTDLEAVADETNIAVLTVKVPVVEQPKEEPKPVTPPETTTPTTPPATETEKKSTEARLKNLGINPNDFSGFKKDKYEYSAEVPNSVSEVKIYADKGHDGQTISGTGNVQLKEGNNSFEIKVTAEDGKTTKTYKLNIKRKTVAEEEAENGENRLKSLEINPKEYDFTGFKSEQTQYSAEVPNEVKEIEISATAIDSRAQITGIGTIELKEGVNDLKIEVIAVNGEKNTYTLTVTRKQTEKTEKFGLSTLTITGLTLNPKFDIETYEYKLDLQEDVNSLEIKTIANTENSSIEIVGNENLKQGENLITILVKDTTINEVATYQIKVNKNVVIANEVEQTSWLKPETWGKEEKIKFAIIIVLIILIICAIILKIKISSDSTNAKQASLPGSEELDKAIAEHQELVDDESVEPVKRKGKHF